MIDSNVTFPDEYPNNPDLAGKEVVFTFTVNSIQKEVTMDTMDDEFASKQFGADSVDGVYKQVRQYLESSAESTHKNDIYSALEDYLLENCTVDMPADYRSDVIEATVPISLTAIAPGMRARWKRYSALTAIQKRALSRNGLTVWRAVSS